MFFVKTHRIVEIKSTSKARVKTYLINTLKKRLSCKILQSNEELSFVDNSSYFFRGSKSSIVSGKVIFSPLNNRIKMDIFFYNYTTTIVILTMVFLLCTIPYFMLTNNSSSGSVIVPFKWNWENLKPLVIVISIFGGFYLFNYISMKEEVDEIIKNILLIDDSREDIIKCCD